MTANASPPSPAPAPEVIVGELGPRPDEPSVRHLQLRMLVDAARAEPPPVLRVDAEAVYAGWQQQRRGQRRGLAVGLAVAAAVLLTVGLLALGPSATKDEPVPMTVQHTPSSPEVASPTGEHGSPEPGAASPTPPATSPVLASSIHVTPLEPTAATAEVLGPRHLRLPDGRWSIDSEGSDPVEVALPDGVLQLRGGSVHVQVAGHVAHVDVLRDEVLRVDAQGRATTLRAQPPAAAATAAAGPTPAALAREAEALMAAGDRQGAIRTLRRLVTRHGRSAAAQAGLIDLGRLLKAAGQANEARCAYGLFLARWPGHALAGDVTRAREALGPGPSCDGLRPE
jgi:hypothetical protein